jgi:cell filamentation protein
MNGRGYDAFDDPYCYKGTSTLKNKAGLKEDPQLEGFELEMTTLRALEPLPAGRFGPAHYKAVHRHLFQDVYRWAGQYRTVRTSKSGNAFCFPEHIERSMDALFKRLLKDPFLGGAHFDVFVAEAASFLAELNAIHPFREGNGRSQLSFLHLVAIRAGHPLALDQVRRDSFLPAMISSFHDQLNPLIAELTAMRRE